MLDIDDLRRKAEAGELTRDEQHRISSAYTRLQYRRSSLARRCLLSNEVVRGLKQRIRKARSEEIDYSEEISELEESISQLEDQKSQLLSQLQEVRGVFAEAKDYNTRTLKPRLREGSECDDQYFREMAAYYEDQNRQIEANIAELLEKMACLEEKCSITEQGLVKKIEKHLAVVRKRVDASRLGYLQKEYLEYRGEVVDTQPCSK